MIMYRDQKIQGHKMIFVEEIIVNIEQFSFYVFIRACNLFNETTKKEKLLKDYISVEVPLV